MIELFAFIILICYLFKWCHCGTLSSSQLAEQTLITSLLNGYNKNIRPDDQVSIDITASLQQIVNMDEKQQIMTSSSFISQTWFDDRLSWIPNSSNNIEVVMLPVKSLWIPDTIILNSADTSGYFTINDYSLASVYYTGQVYMILPALTIRTKCNLIVQKFPFDRQICSINLTSWAQGTNKIAYTENRSLVIDISQYIEHPLWQLTGTDMTVFYAEDRAPFEDTFNNVISIQLYLKRKPLFFIINGIFACLVLNCVILIAYVLPFVAQINLCMICFMTYSVYSLNFSNLFPQQSQYIMMITLFFLLSIGWTFVSMIWFVIYNYYITKGQMPRSLLIFSEWLQKLFLCCCCPIHNETDQKKDIILENGQSEKSADEEVTKAANIEKMKNVPCLKRRIKVENINNKQENSVEDGQSIKTNEKGKFKCNFCNRCETCQAGLDKDKKKGKDKKDIEAKCNALNYFILFCITILMFISNIVLWLIMAQ